MTRRVDPLMPAAGDWLQSLDFCCDTLSMALQATAFSFDSNRPCLLERGKPGAFKQIALENALLCRNVSHIYGKHTTYRDAVCGVDHTVSLISDRPCLLVSIIGPGAIRRRPRISPSHLRCTGAALSRVKRPNPLYARSIQKKQRPRSSQTEALPSVALPMVCSRYGMVIFGQKSPP